jgi:uncharacterized protein YndB with AHSA1/START domain
VWVQPVSAGSINVFSMGGKQFAELMPFVFWEKWQCKILAASPAFVWIWPWREMMNQNDTVYVIYIAAHPEKIWAALTEGSFTRQYFFGLRIEGEWKAGSAVKYFRPDNTVDISGRVLRCDPAKLLSFTWHVESDPMAARLPDCIVTFQLESLGGVVRLTLTEEHPQLPDERLLEGGRRGWPAILSGLKTLVETGQPLPAFDTTYQKEGGAYMQRVISELKL